MGKKTAKTTNTEEPKTEIKEGNNLLGKPKFKKLESGRYRCVETGHEVPNEEAKAAYANTKHCRIGLIDSAIAKKKPPLNIFKQDPASRSKLICQLTGDTINKSEEHIWKHINGKRFLNMLEKKEAEKQTGGDAIEGEQTPNGEPKKDHVNEKKTKKDKKKKKKEEKKKEKDDNIIKPHSEMTDSSAKENDSEKEDFWMPPDGERWDMDDGGDRWGSGSDSDSDAELEPEDEVADGADATADDESKDEAGELSKRTKRMSIEIGPSSFASRKKKNKTESEE